MAQGVPGRLRSRIFLTFRHYKGGSSSVKRTGRLYPRRNSWYSLSEVESTSGHMVLSWVPRKKSPVTPPEIDPGTVRLVAQCLNHYATPGPISQLKLSKSKSKGLPQQAEVAQRVPGRLRPPIFLSFRHYRGGSSSAKRTGRLYPRRNPWFSLSEAESTSGHMVLSGEPRKESPVTPPRIDPGIVRLVAQRLNHYATPGHFTEQT